MSDPLDGYHPMVRDFILGKGCFSQEAQIEAARRVGEKIGKAAAEAMNESLLEAFAPALEAQINLDHKVILDLSSQRTKLVERVAELESAAKLAPAANADGGSNHATPAASGAAVNTPESPVSSEVVAWGVIIHRDAEVLCVPFTVREAADHFVRLNGVSETMTVVPLYAAQADATPCEARDDQIQETLTLPQFKDKYDSIINDALAERRRMPWLFGKPATELSKRELLALAILQANPMSSYVSKEQF